MIQIQCLGKRVAVFELQMSCVDSKVIWQYNSAPVIAARS